MFALRFLVANVPWKGWLTRTKETLPAEWEADEEERQAMSTDERLAGIKGSELQHPRSVKRQIENDDSDDEDSPDDEVRLWEDGWKDRYYVAKFDASPENTVFRQNLARDYIRGLCWVLRYYVEGCPSWTWFFPHLYAPFASDFDEIGEVAVDFDTETEPVKPMEQLMSVLPASSSRFLPEPLADLMEDPRSPIVDFYPLDFKIDLNGHKHVWQGVALLPFIEEPRLLDAVRAVYPLLDNEQALRNSEGDNMLYVRRGQAAYDSFASAYEICDDYDEERQRDKNGGSTTIRAMLSSGVTRCCNVSRELLASCLELQLLSTSTTSNFSISQQNYESP
ncbi:hypothetical protein HPB51_027636 [Rhipicephalus microplus]|uniref:Xrn1 helical domain-containing protein n=1 Tax=Rhipicephalus microplus TaxID=6941 RepID=A0A9J6CZL8_RHIMP|nr:hypothetical protein HPB51_027636 [Rhipicephalus microplus]